MSSARASAKRLTDGTIAALPKAFREFDACAFICERAWREEDVEVRPQSSLKPSMTPGRLAPDHKRGSSFEHLRAAWRPLDEAMDALRKADSDGAAAALAELDKRRRVFNSYHATVFTLHKDLPPAMKLSPSEKEAEALRAQLRALADTLRARCAALDEERARLPRDGAAWAGEDGALADEGDERAGAT